MFCPNCNTFMLEGQLIKSNVKKFHETEVEYDARCPFCQVRIGRMFWGRLEVAEGLTYHNLSSYSEPLPGPQEHGFQHASYLPEEEEPYCETEYDDYTDHYPEPQPDSLQKYGSYREPPPYSPPSYYYCPYCGHPLPEEKHKLPYKSGFGENI